MLEDRTLLSSSGPTSGAVQAAYDQLPLAFEANQGQAAAPINFVAHGSGYALDLTPSAAVLALQKPASTSVPSTTSTPGDVVQLQLVGANPAAPAVGQDELITKSNYFIGNNPSQWHTNIPNFGEVEYQNVYPGINLVYYGNQGQLEYDFVLAPGADPSAITLSVQGTQSVTLDGQGNLVLQTSGGDVLEKAPVLYQELDGVRQAVSGHFVLEGNNQVGFQVAAYDPSRPLVIDPVLSYSTYLGGSGGNAGTAIAVDNSGDAYITGFTFSSDFPTFPNPGAFQTTPGGCFVTKLNASGMALLYSTYLGSADYGTGIAVDSSGDAYVTGYEQLGDIPTTAGAFQMTAPGGNVVGSSFVTELNPDGTGLVYSTYLHGSNGAPVGDQAHAIVVDSSGDAYVTGFAPADPNFPTTATAYQKTASGGGFVTELNASGTALLYSTYLGGSSGLDFGYGIAVDSSGYVYVTGYADSSDFPMTATAFQRTLGTNGNAFVAKLNTNLSGLQSLVYSTYLGGSGGDKGNGIAVDSSGDAYVTGYTYSSDFPTTAGAFQTTFLGNISENLSNAFVAKLDTNLSGADSLIYSTYLGGTGGDEGGGIAVDGSGNAYVVGDTASSDFPTTADALQTTFSNNTFFGPSSTAFVTELNAGGTALLYSTYLDGSVLLGSPITGSVAPASVIAVDTSGNAYVTGFTDSSNFPTTPGAYQTTLGANGDAFVAKLTLSPTVTVANPTISGPSTVSFTVTASDPNSADQQTGFTYNVNWGDGSPVYTSAPGQQSLTVPGHSYSPGVYLVQVTATDQDGNTGPVGSVVVVVGTPSGGDTISLTGGTSVGDVSATFNGTPFDSQGATQGVFVWGQGGSDTYTVNFDKTLVTPITLLGSASDTLTVNGSTDPNTSNYITNNKSAGTISWSDSAGPPAQITTYSGVGAVTINGGAGPNYITDPGARTTINGGPGQNTVVITATTGNGVVLNGGPSSSTDNYIIDMGNLAGPVTINSTTGTSTVAINGPLSGSNLLTLSSTQLTGDGETINLNLGTTATSFTVAGGGGNNQLVVQGTPPGPLTVQNLAPTIGAISAPAAPTPLGTAISASASFSDLDGDNLTALWNWGDNTTTSQTLSQYGTSGTVTASHTYTAAGVYTVTLTLSDASNPNLSGQSTFQYVVIYDASAGFTTGGGWFTSPAGAYAANPTLTGQANFGFNAKYKSGSTVPTGQTEFQFPAANLDFHSTSYDWLVLNGSQAQFQGSGTINGSGNYGFVVTVADNDAVSGGGPDAIRIQIWDKNNNNAIVYDTQPGAALTAGPTTLLGGGDIQVHSSSAKMEAVLVGSGKTTTSGTSQPTASAPATSASNVSSNTGRSAEISQGVTVPSITDIPGNSNPFAAAEQVLANLALMLSEARNAYQTELSAAVALWQSIDALALQRLDALLSLEAGAMGMSKDTLIRDLLFASRFSINGM